MNKPHVRKIKEGLRKHAKKLLMGTFIFATSPEAIVSKKILTDTSGAGAQISLLKFGIRSGRSLFIREAQHRNQGRAGAVERDAEARGGGRPRRPGGRRAPAEVLRADRDRARGRPDEISRMFVTLASTGPISPSLIAVMDRESLANRFGLAVAKDSARVQQSASTAMPPDVPVPLLAPRSGAIPRPGSPSLDPASVKSIADATGFAGLRLDLTASGTFR